MRMSRVSAGLVDLLTLLWMLELPLDVLLVLPPALTAPFARFAAIFSQVLLTPAGSIVAQSQEARGGGGGLKVSAASMVLFSRG